MESSKSGIQSVAVMTVATGKYYDFIPRLRETFEEFFLEGRANLYVFSDREGDIDVKHYGWPKMPLLRFPLYLKHKVKEDYVFSLDADVIFCRPVGEEILTDRLGVLHRNYLKKFNNELPYERNKASEAYIPPNKGTDYYVGGFVGGTNEEFYKLAGAVTENIEKDRENGIRAIWGDESQINRYFVDNPPTRVLGPEYMCPIQNMNFRAKIVHLDKQFKRVYRPDAESYTKINPKEYRF